MSSIAERRAWHAGVYALAASLAVAGCTDYLDRRQTISFHAGDAIATNKAVQTIDPWPRLAQRADFDTNGQRIGAAIDRYNNGRVYPPLAPSTTTIAPPLAPPIPGGPAVSN
jgi:hypothetical protein